MVWPIQHHEVPIEKNCPVRVIQGKNVHNPLSTRYTGYPYKFFLHTVNKIYTKKKDTVDDLFHNIGKDYTLDI